VNALDKQLMLPAVLLFLAAVIFAGALVWHDTVGTKNAQTTTPNVAAPVSNVASSESNIPHFAAGNINGTITAVSVTKMTMAVAQPDSTSGPVNTIVMVDSDTQIYTIGALKVQ
jgi:hypothetical protein